MNDQNVFGNEANKLFCQYEYVSNRSFFSFRRLQELLPFRIHPLFTKLSNVLSTNLVKSRSREIGCYNDPIGLKFDRPLGSTPAGMPVKF